MRHTVNLDEINGLVTVATPLSSSSKYGIKRLEVHTHIIVGGNFEVEIFVIHKSAGEKEEVSTFFDKIEDAIFWYNSL